jgi:hypothetical protein
MAIIRARDFSYLCGIERACFAQIDKLSFSALASFSDHGSNSTTANLSKASFPCSILSKARSYLLKISYDSRRPAPNVALCWLDIPAQAQCKLPRYYLLTSCMPPLTHPPSWLIPLPFITLHLTARTLRTYRPGPYGCLCERCYRSVLRWAALIYSGHLLPIHRSHRPLANSKPDRYRQA